MSLPAPKPLSDADEPPFWRRKAMKDMTPAEWESLCDGCGRCCLVKLEEEETEKTHFTDVACFMLDCDSCLCSDYQDRKRHVPDCVTLTPELVRTVDWLPPTCAYRLLAEGDDLYWWHPLVSGDPDTVHEAGVSVRGRVSAKDSEVGPDDWQDHLVHWPKRFPKKARERG